MNKSEKWNIDITGKNKKKVYYLAKIQKQILHVNEAMWLMFKESEPLLAFLFSILLSTIFEKVIGEKVCMCKIPNVHINFSSKFRMSFCFTSGSLDVLVWVP